VALGAYGALPGIYLDAWGGSHITPHPCLQALLHEFGDPSAFEARVSRAAAAAPPCSRYTCSVVTGSDGVSSAISYTTTFSQPSAVLQLPSGRFAILDAGAHRLRLVQPGGTTVAVVGGEAGFRDGNLRTALLNGPADMCVAPDGSLIIADAGNDCLRLITGAPVVQPEDGVWPRLRHTAVAAAATAAAADGRCQLPSLQFSAVQSLAGKSGEEDCFDGADASKCRLSSPSSVSPVLIPKPFSRVRWRRTGV